MPEPDTPFRILILGDFSGRANRGVKEPLAARRPRAVDNDNLEQLMTDMVVSLQLPHVRLRFRELDDFHPDHIYASAELFQRLEDARTDPPALTATAPERAAARPAAVSGTGLLDSMIAETEEVSASQVMEEPDAFVKFLNQIMKPHLEPRPDARVVKWSARIDAIAGEQMREVLHHPDFQAIEAAWRAVWMLVQRLDPDQELKILLFDATLEELLADAASIRKCLDSADGWGAIVGNYNFGQEPGDAARLQLFGKIAASLGAPFLSEGQPPAEGEPPAHWMELAKSANARWIGLALPQVPAAAAVRTGHLACRILRVRGDAGERACPLSLGQSGVLLRAAAGTGISSRRVEPAPGVAPAGGGFAAARLPGGRGVRRQTLRGNSPRGKGCGVPAGERHHAAGVAEGRGCGAAGAVRVDCDPSLRAGRPLGELAGIKRDRQQITLPVPSSIAQPPSRWTESQCRPH